MKKLLLVLSLMGFCCPLIYAQELSGEEKEKIKERYFGNEDFYRAVQLIDAGNTEEGRKLYLKASDEFQLEKKWLAYVRANQRLIMSYRFAKAYQAGLDRGGVVIEVLENYGDEAYRYTFHIYRELARIFGRNQNFDKALEYHFEEKEILEKYWTEEIKEGEYPYYYGSTHNDIASLYIQLEDYEKGKQFYLKAIEIGERAKNCDLCKVLMANASTNLGGNYYRDKAMMIEAIKYIEQGIKWFEEAKGKNDLGLINQYLNRINLSNELEEWEISKEYYSKIIYIIEQSGSQEDRYIKFHLPNSLFNYAMLRAIDQEYEEAQISVDKLIKLVGDDIYLQHYKVKALIASAKIAYDNKQFEQAEIILLEADSVNNHLADVSNGKAENSEVLIFLNYSNLWIEQSDYEKAIYYRLKACKSPIIENSNKISTYNELSELYLLNNQLDSADIYNRIVLKSVAKRFRPKNFFDLPKLEQLKDRTDVYDVLKVKAAIANDRAENSSRISEKDSLYRLALDAIQLEEDYYKQSLKTTNLLRGAYSKGVFGKHSNVMEVGLKTIYDQFKYNQDNALLDEAFDLMQNIKAQKLALSLLNEEALSFGKVPSELILKERDLVVQIQEYERDLRKAKRKKNTALIDTLENHLIFNSKAEYKDLLNLMENSYPEYYEAKFDMKLEDLASMKEVLKEDEVVIEYMFVEDNLQILLIDSQGKSKYINVPMKDNIFEEVQTFVTTLETSAAMRKDKRAELIKAGYHLYQQLLQPIEEYIKETKKLIVIPSAWIYYIPFEALIPSDEILGFSDLDFLIKQFDISYHYSSTLFAKTRRSERKGNLSMYAFAPVYDSGEESERLVSPQSSNLRALDENSTFGPLPESEKEVKALKRLFEKKDRDVKIALRKEANEQELKKNLEKTFQFVHIAGHSFADTDNPDFSGIACYESENEDGILYLGEINYLNMKADLITLSSCESGFGKLNFAEGLLGLNRAFMYAGCPNVVFSLWKVYDKVSANLMVDFYESVLEGKSYSESLRQAKSALLEKESTANPHFWAPYLLIGR